MTAEYTRAAWPAALATAAADQPTLLAPATGPGRGNDYRHIQAARDRFVAEGRPLTLPVTVLFPVYNRKQMLARSLAGLTHQTYPRELIEVVVADDGSSDGVEEVIEKYRQYFPIKHVYQEDRGYRLSASRNNGLRAASHEHIVLLDCDMIPGPDVVASFMEYMHVTDDALLIGHRRFVLADDLTDEDILADIDVAMRLPDIVTGNNHFKRKRDPTKDWRLRIYAASDMLRDFAFPFSVCSGCNLAYSKRLWAAAGPYCEDFTHWGGEDMEWSYRVYATGAWFVPVPASVALHQEPPGGVNETDRVAGEVHSDPIKIDRCPLLYRDPESDQRYSVPRVSACLSVGADPSAALTTIESVLSQQPPDLELLLWGAEAEPPGSLAPALADSRVRWLDAAPTDADAMAEACAGAFVAPLEPGDVLEPDALRRATKALDKHNAGLVYAGPVTGEDERLRVFRARDWVRARRAGQALTGLDDGALFEVFARQGAVVHLPEALLVSRAR